MQGKPKFKNSAISAHPEVILARELAAASESAKETGKVKTIILAGTSNLGSLKPIFLAHGANVIDLTKPGWMITEKNLELLSQELSALSNMEDTAVIFGSCHFRQLCLQIQAC